MSDSNLIRVMRIPEGALGVPTGGRGQLLELTGENFDFAVDFTESERISPDRNSSGSIDTAYRVNGSLKNELSFSQNRDEIESAMFNRFTKVAEIVNIVADTQITQVTDSSDTVTVAAGGAAFRVGHLARMSGFTNANNSGNFRVASSTATTVVFSGSPVLTDEAVPPLGATIKAVGFQGASGDILAGATGLTSTTLNFTALGLTVGQWIKIGGTALATQFSAPALNGFARITAIAAGVLTLDNRPAGWTTNNGAGKTISVWFADFVRNGATEISHTYEKSYGSQASPKFYRYNGLIADTMAINIATGSISTIDVGFLGLTSTIENATFDAAPFASPVEDPFNAVSDVARMIEGGVNILNNNPAQSFSISLGNNLREKPAIGVLGSFDLGIGGCDVTGQIQTYFQNDDLYAKFLTRVKTSIGCVFKRNNRVMIFFLPTVTITKAPISEANRNTDISVSLSYRAQKEVNQLYSLQIDTFSYIEE